MNQTRKRNRSTSSKRCPRASHNHLSSDSGSDRSDNGSSSSGSSYHPGPTQSKPPPWKGNKRRKLARHPSNESIGSSVIVVQPALPQAKTKATVPSEQLTKKGPEGEPKVSRDDMALSSPPPEGSYNSSQAAGMLVGERRFLYRVKFPNLSRTKGKRRQGGSWSIPSDSEDDLTDPDKIISRRTDKNQLQAQRQGSLIRQPQPLATLPSKRPCLLPRSFNPLLGDRQCVRDSQGEDETDDDATSQDINGGPSIVRPRKEKGDTIVSKSMIEDLGIAQNKESQNAQIQLAKNLRQQWEQAASQYPEEVVEDQLAMNRAACAPAGSKQNFETADLGWNVQAKDQAWSEGALPSSKAPSPMLLGDHDVHDRQARHFQECLEDSIMRLSAEGWKIGEEKQFSAQDQPYQTWLQCSVVLPIFASMGKEMLGHIINGTLGRGREESTQLRKQLRRNLLNNDSQPAIYLQELTDAKGYAPTPSELDFVLRTLRDYCKPAAELTRDQVVHFDRIQRIFNPGAKFASIAEDHPKYISKKGHRSQGRIDEVLHFCDNVSERVKLRRNTSAWDLPFGSSLVEVGYSIEPARRLGEHRNHESSNYIMNLVEAITKSLYADKYQIVQYVVFPIFQDEQASIAEKIITNIAQGYTSSGSGFSHEIAGRSVNSTWGVSSGSWHTFMNHAFARTDLRQNMIREHKLAEEKSRKSDLAQQISQQRSAARQRKTTQSLEDLSIAQTSHTAILSRTELIAHIQRLRRQSKLMKEAEAE